MYKNTFCYVYTYLSKHLCFDKLTGGPGAYEWNNLPDGTQQGDYNTYDRCLHKGVLSRGTFLINEYLRTRNLYPKQLILNGNTRLFW